MQAISGFRYLTMAACLLCAAFNQSCLLAEAKEKISLQSLTPKMDQLPPRKMLQGSVEHQVSVPQQPVNVLGFAQKGAHYPKTVTYVQPDSPAWQRGLQPGDQILEEHAVPPIAGMIIKRGKNSYFCMIPMPPGIAAKLSNANIAGGAQKTEAQSLANHSIVMMIDDSASMGTLDCPGNKSRWQWCREHVSDLYRESNGLLEKNISIVTFDSNYRSYRNCAPSKLADVFNTVTPAGETNMAPALDEAFSIVRSQLEHGQPALISLISDGRPTDVSKVKTSIISEVNHLTHPELLSIVFIEVGTPEHYLQELDNDLVKQGAAKDIVKVIPFGSVNSQSLVVTLSSAIPKLDTPATIKLSGATSAENEARKARDVHVSTSPPRAVAKPVAHAAPPIRPAPPIKAHPSGTPRAGEVVPVKPVEVDERESVLKHAANKTY